MATYDPALLDALENLDAGDLDRRVYRHMFNDYTPERANTSGARWNPPGTAAIYTSLEEDTAKAEGDHAIAVQPRRVFARRVMYEVDVEVPKVLNLTDPAVLTALNMSSADIEDDDFAACQQIGGAAAWLGFGGLLVPSARSAGTNLVIFPEAVDIEFRTVDHHDLPPS